MGTDFRNRLKDALAKALPVYDREADYELSQVELGHRVSAYLNGGIDRNPANRRYVAAARASWGEVNA